MARTGILLAAMWLQSDCDDSLSLVQTQLLVRQRHYTPALTAELERRKSLVQIQSSARESKGKSEAWEKSGKGPGLIRHLLKLGSKRPLALPDVVPANALESKKNLIKLSSKGPSALLHVPSVNGKPPRELHNAARMCSVLQRTHQTPETLQRVKDGEIELSELEGIGGLQVFLVICFSIFAVNSFRDVRNFYKLVRRSPDEDMSHITGSPPPEQKSTWSTASLVCLTAYRFYTGFLTATWLPYLLAMEGQYLWHENQSMFMGVAKLIYGATILTNPILGLVGDRAVQLSHGLARRLFVQAGVAFAGLGILICLVAADINYFYTFMFGITVWRMGEAINDVTTEGIVPELVPPEEFQHASAVKAAMFLVGGLVGYICLILAAGIHYSWLYYAYLVMMIITCIPPLFLLNDDTPGAPKRNSGREWSFSTEMVEAYLVPARIEGGFPRSCLAVFIFSLGTAPMFFLMLITRDVVGIIDPVQLQVTFSGVSITFFLASALAAVLSGAGPPKPPSASPSTQQVTSPAQADGDSPLVKNIMNIVYSVSTFGVLCVLVPCIGLAPLYKTRLIFFYVIAVFFGCAFGLAFSQFQGITWQLLPAEDTDWANAMGFNVMSRLLGLGVGNFIGGLLLDFFYVDLEIPNGEVEGGGYSLTGYFVMCITSAIAVIISAILCYTIARQYRAEEEFARKSKSLIAAAG